MEENKIIFNKQVFLFATHFYSRKVLRDFKALQKATKNFGPCLILYHQKDNENVHPSILKLPHYIFTYESLSRLGYKCFIDNQLVPASNHFPLLLFSRENEYCFYWYIEYDVRFNGRWEDFFSYFTVAKEDFLTSHIRRYYDEPEWEWWILRHPIKQIMVTECLRSFNPIYRISYDALRYIDKMHANGWQGHHEILFPTLLNKGAFKIRDFGGSGVFASTQDKKMFYDDSSSHSLLDGSLRHRDSYTWLFYKPRNKLYHPVKGGKRRFLKTFFSRPLKFLKRKLLRKM